MAGFVTEGAFYCRGGFQRLADAFVTGLDHQGGELLVGHRVKRIHVAGGRVTGVELDGGRRFSATDIVATGDARETFGRLVGHRHLPRRLRRRIRRSELSPAFCSMYLGTDLDVAALGARHETLVCPSWDLDAAFHSALGGDTSTVMVTIPTLTDPTIAPDGRHQVVVTGAMPDPTTRPDLARLADGYLIAAEHVVPQLAGHIIHAAGGDGAATPATSPPIHPIPAPYGWAMTPEQSGDARLAQTTPIPGLTLAGQWTQPGHGIWTVMASGIRAARLVLGRNTDQGLIPLSV